MSDPMTASRGLDGMVERLGRWTASRTTRRSFLGKLGRAGVLVAGGTAMATFLADRAEARVCGQSGVAPLCDTFTCNETWGWCWYASGCCADGALKKICDCCAPNTPHPVGYCPSGTRVLCIVESCGADPRVMTKPVHLLGVNGPTALTVALSALRFPTSPMAVIGDAEDALFGAVAASLGHMADAPVLLVPRGPLPATVRAELDRLEAEFVTVAGPHVPAVVDEDLVAAGRHVERVGESDDPGRFSAEVAAWSRPLTGARTAVVVVSGGFGALGPAAALANAERIPLLLGGSDAVQQVLRQPRGVRRTYVVTGDPDDARRFPRGEAITAPDAFGLAAALASLVGALRAGEPPVVTLASRDAPMASVAMATVPGPLLLHLPGTLDGARRWLLDHRVALTEAHVAGDRSSFPAQAIHDLQSLVNEFETHLLTGQAGEGLPVIPQPREERPIGKARR